MELKFKESDLNLFERFKVHCKQKGKTPEALIIDLIWDELNSSIGSLKALERRVQTLENTVESLQNTPETEVTFAEWLDAELKRLRKLNITAKDIYEKVGMSKSTFHSLKHRDYFNESSKKLIRKAIKELEK